MVVARFLEQLRQSDSILFIALNVLQSLFSWEAGWFSQVGRGVQVRIARGRSHWWWHLQVDWHGGSFLCCIWIWALRLWRSFNYIRFTFKAWEVVTVDTFDVTSGASCRRWSEHQWLSEWRWLVHLLGLQLTVPAGGLRRRIGRDYLKWHVSIRVLCSIHITSWAYQLSLRL